jgi:hypothetical protein
MSFQVSSTPHHHIMQSSTESNAIVPDSNTVQPTLHEDDTQLVCLAEIQLLHEATLQDLLHNRNYAIEQLLYEHNDLLKEQ